ncbi:MAG: hypothetical protein AAB225_02040 [Acidobacteriota bacterium]
MRLVLPLLFSVALAGASQAEIIDRIAVTVDDQVITNGELLQEIRLTAFLNGQPPDFSPAARRAAAEQLVEQHLILRDMELTRFSSPPAADVDRMLQQYSDTRQRELARYGISERDLRARLERQAAVLRYIDFRFKPEVQASQPETIAQRVDEIVERWLKEARQRARIRYREAAFR